MLTHILKKFNVNKIRDKPLLTGRRQTEARAESSKDRLPANSIGNVDHGISLRTAGSRRNICEDVCALARLEALVGKLTWRFIFNCEPLRD
jgi:hypothetical protein